MNKGLFIMIDGIAGSGKTTVLQAIYDFLKEKGLRCFRLQDWEKSDPPTFQEIADYDVYFTFEPTKTWIGAAIRKEMSQTEKPYDGEEIAQAFALDREIMYRRLILPALKAGKIVIQDRGFTSSLAYQIEMPNALSFEEIGSLPGNLLALANAPTHLVLTSIPVETVMMRIASRKDDNKGIFQDPVLLRKVDANFRGSNFRTLLTEAGTTIFDLDTSGSLSETKTNAVQLIENLLEKTKE
jgi:dTMP kinase